jgi:hypothetical protein
VKKPRMCACGHEVNQHHARPDGTWGHCLVCGGSKDGCDRPHGKRGGVSKVAAPKKTISVPGSEARIRAAMAELTEAIVEFARPRAPQSYMPVNHAVVRVAATPIDSRLKPASTAPVDVFPKNFPASELSRGAFTVLTAMAQGADGIPSIAVMTSYKTRSITTYLSELRRKNCVDRFEVLPEGKRRLGPGFKPLPTGDALRRYWIEKLGEGEGRLFETFVTAYPEVVGVGQVQDMTGYAPRSVTTYISALKRRKLIVKVGREYKASPHLFDAARATA